MTQRTVAFTTRTRTRAPSPKHRGATAAAGLGERRHGDQGGEREQDSEQLKTGERMTLQATKAGPS